MPTDELRAACERLTLYFDPRQHRDESEVYDAAWHEKYGADLRALQDLHGGCAPVVIDWRIVANAYLAEHDPTPLTLDVLREELGEGLDKGAFVYWEIGCSSVMWSRESIYCPDHASFRGIRITTLGQLRRAISLAEGV